MSQNIPSYPPPDYGYEQGGAGGAGGSGDGGGYYSSGPSAAAPPTAAAPAGVTRYQLTDDTYAPKPSRPSPAGGYGFDYNFGLGDGRGQEDERDPSQAQAHARPGPSSSNMDASGSSSSAAANTAGYPQSYFSANQLHAQEIDRVPSAASTSSKTGLNTSVTVTKAHDFGAQYPDGWTQEDMEAEKEFLKSGIINWTDLKDWRFWIRAKWWYYYVAGAIIIVLVCLMSIYHHQIVEWCEPVANKLKALPGGWAIPIGILFIISFPPLFGHEIVAIICGLVWGLWVGFGIVCAGTFLGEVGNYYAFKYCCRSRAEKYERKNMLYACLAHTMREGSLWIIIAARLSAIPGHLTTAVFSTCGMNIWIFMLGAFLTLPKQLITVYLGVIFKEGASSTKNRIISYTVLAIGFLITIGAAWWIWYEMHKIRVIVWRKRRMEMASRGISLSEMSHKDDLEAAPMLAMDPPHSAGHHLGNPYASTTEYAPVPPHTSDRLRDLGARDGNMRASYHTPYDINYNRTGDDMSVYNVDTAMAERANIEADIAERLNSPSHVHGHQHQAFPQAHASGVRREPSAASAFYRPGEERPEVIPSTFPTVNPYTR